MNGYSSNFALYLKQAHSLQNMPGERNFATTRELMNNFLPEARAHEQNLGNIRI